jgi:hypothetical protein
MERWELSAIGAPGDCRSGEVHVEWRSPEVGSAHVGPSYSHWRPLAWSSGHVFPFHSNNVWFIRLVTTFCCCRRRICCSWIEWYAMVRHPISPRVWGAACPHHVKISIMTFMRERRELLVCQGRIRIARPIHKWVYGHDATLRDSR